MSEDAVPGNRNDWASSAWMYNTILGAEKYESYARFVASVLEEYRAQTVLELGSGSGLYQIPLVDMGLQVEGLDISEQMLAVAAEHRPELVLHHGDMTSFSLDSKFDAVLCLNSSLTLVATQELMEETVRRAAAHLCPNGPGILLIDLPNHAVEIPEEDGSVCTEQFPTRETDGFAEAPIDVTFSNARVGSTWVSEWIGMVEGKLVFNDKFSELIFEVPLFEQALEGCGFEVKAMYGSRDGEPFDEQSSWRRFYVLQRSGQD